MKNWLKNFVMCLSLFAMGSSTALACQISGSGLPDEMEQKLKVQCEQMKLDAAAMPEVSAQKVTEWAQISQEFAKAIGLAARELNVSVNDFIVTPAGMITVGVILWSTLGKDLLLVLSIFFVAVVVWLLNRSLWFSHYDKKPRGFWIFRREVLVRRYFKYRDMEEGSLLWCFFSLAVLFIYSTVVLVNL